LSFWKLTRAAQDRDLLWIFGNAAPYPRKPGSQPEQKYK